MRKWFNRHLFGIVCAIIFLVIAVITIRDELADRKCVTVRPGQTTTISNVELRMASMDTVKDGDRILTGAVLTATSKKPSTIFVTVNARFDAEGNRFTGGNERSEKWGRTVVHAGENSYSIPAAPYGDGRTGATITDVKVCMTT